MLDVSTLTAADILAIPEDQPERLFETPGAVAGRYRALAMRWHPDRAARLGLAAVADDVFRRVALLHAEAREKLDAGTWQVPGIVELLGSDGMLRRVRYLREFDVGVGRAYLGRSVLAYAIRAEFADLAETARATINGLRFRDEPIGKAMAPRLPKLRTSFPTREGVVLVVEKSAGLIRLRDLLDHAGGRLDPRHVAWVVSELLNLACYLEWAGLAHGDLSLDSVFVSPADHTACLLGGWWHTAPVGSRLASLPARTLAVAPRAALDAKRASLRTDLELVRLTARELLGDETGASLRTDATIPRSLGEWLRLPAASSPREEYADWQAVLHDSFGARRFTELPITASDIYGEGA